MSDRITWTNERRRLGDLQPWPRNPRQIKTDQAKRLVQSFDEFGQVETIAIGPDSEIYNGHQRLNVLMQEYGADYHVEVRTASRALTEKEREKLTVYLHKGAAGEWDFDTLANEFELDDLLEWGFDKKELDLDLWAGEPQEDPGAQIDKAEELREKWGVETGQLWQLGEHRLICGDCTDRAVVERVMGGEKADSIITDPPYNVDKDVWDTNILPMLKSSADLLPEIITDKGICFWFSATRYIPEVINATAALPYRWMFIWYPSNNMAHGDLGFQKFTAALVLGKAKVWRENMQDLREYPIKIMKENPGHPTPKPIDLIDYLVEMASEKIVFDGFLGSGTTLIACERLSRKCRAVEISPAYCAVAIQRWVDMTGGIPTVIQNETEGEHA